MTARCDLTDLLVSQCACRLHRGEPVPVLPEVETAGLVFEAQYPGVCARCEGRIVVGDRIARTADPGVGYVHVESGRCRS